MHTSAHTIRRGGKLYYNRRVPRHAVALYGPQIRLRIDSHEQAALLTQRLDAVWSNPGQSCRIDLEGLLAVKDSPPTLTEAATEYLSFRSIEQKDVWLAIRTLISVAGDVGIDHYSRRDGRAFVQAQLQTSRTGTVRRRLNSLCAIFNYAYKEYEIDRRNPFAGLLIPKEGKDRQQRQPFAQLQLHLMGAFAQFERSIIKKRQAEGIAKAKVKGVYKGRSKSIDRDKVKALRADGLSTYKIAEQLGVSRMSVHRILNEAA